MLASFYIIASWASRISVQFGKYVAASKAKILNWLSNGYTIYEIAKKLYDVYF